MSKGTVEWFNNQRVLAYPARRRQRMCSCTLAPLSTPSDPPQRRWHLLTSPQIAKTGKSVADNQGRVSVSGAERARSMCLVLRPGQWVKATEAEQYGEPEERGYDEKPNDRGSPSDLHEGDSDCRH